MKSQKNYALLPSKTIISFFLVSIIIIVIIIYVRSKVYENVREKNFEELGVIAKLKTEEILNFINSEKYKLKHLISSERFQGVVYKFLQSPKYTSEIVDYFNEVKFLKHLEDIVLLDSTGKILFQFKPTIAENDVFTKSLNEQLREDTIFIDIITHRKSDIVYFYQFPIFDSKGHKGFIRFEYDARKNLFSRADYLEPFSSKEILLVKKGENEIVYLSYLRRVKLEALQLNESLTDASCWNMDFSLKNMCYYIGLDYAGVPSLLVFNKIPETNWILIVKKDYKEAFKDFINHNYIILLSTFLLLLIIGGLLLGYIYRLRYKQEKRVLEILREREKVKQQYHIIVQMMNDVLFLINTNGEIISTSQAVKKMYGYEPEELIGKRIDVVCNVKEFNELQLRFSKIIESNGYIYDSIHKRKDGTEFNVEVSAKAIELEESTYLLGIVRDVSERKKFIETLNSRLSLEEKLNDFAKELIEATVDNFDEKIIKILEKAGKFLRFDRFKIFLKKKDGNFFCKYEWCKEGIPSTRERLISFDLQKSFPFLYEQLQSRQIYFCGDINSLMAEASAELKEMLKQNINSFIWKPLFFKDDLFGFFSINGVDKKVELKDEYSIFLNIFGDMFSNALKRIEYEKDVLEQQEIFKKLTDKSKEVILILNKNFKNVYISSSVQNILGYTIEERMYQDLLELIHPDDRKITLNSIKDVTAQPNLSKTIILRAKHKSGNYIWLEVTLTNLLEDPNINGIVVNYHDISELKAFYSKIQESEERYRLLTEETGVVLYRLNYSTMKYDYISDVIEKLTGYSVNEINDIGFANIIEQINLILNPEKSKEEIIEDRRTGKTGEYLADYQIRTKSGERKWIRDHSFPLLDDEGKIIGSLGILIDVTELKELENEIKRREQYLEALIEIQKSLIFSEEIYTIFNNIVEKLGQVTGVSRCYIFENSYDKNGRLLMSQKAEWCNKGITPQIDNPLLQNLPYDELGYDLVGEFLGKVAFSGLVKNFPEPLKSILESQSIIYICLIPIFMKEKWWGFIGFDECYKERGFSKMEIEMLKSTASSISLALESQQRKQELIKARDEALEANRLKSGFLSMMSHEIRTPLNSILGYSALLKEMCDDTRSEDVKKYFEIIEKGGKRLLDTITKILEISRLESGDYLPNVKIIRFVDLIDNIINSLTIVAEAKGLSILKDYPQKDITLETDEYCVYGIFENIISNAIKYSKRGKILVSIKEEEDCIVCIVKDEGVGMSDEYQKHLFKTFSQEDLSYKRKYEGTGLGLAITKHYADLIGAQIEIESQKNVGTKVTVRIPRKLLSN